MATNWDDAYFVRREETDKLADIYGVEKKDHIKKSMFGERGFTAKDYEDYEKAISRTANNHYDTRRPIEAAKQAEYKGADKLSSGINNLESTDKAYNFLNDYHKNELGNSKELKNPNDFAAVTNAFVAMDRDKLTNSFNEYRPEKQKEKEDVIASPSRNKQSEAQQFADKYKLDLAAGLKF